MIEGMNMKKKFTTEIRAAKVAARFGWKGLDDAAANKLANESVNWRRRDSANIARIASALEQISRKLSKIDLPN